MSLNESINLTDKVVLVTRPQHQSAEFISLIEQGGGRALPFPSIEIEPVALDDELTALLTEINSYDMLIFISANAVTFAVSLLRKLNIQAADIKCDIAVIGKATCGVAKSAGFNVSIRPENGFNSKALLTLASLQKEQIQQRKVLIVRGSGGLDELADTLTDRNALVTYAEVYRRRAPEQDIELKRESLSQNWGTYSISDITVTSNESLQNLYDMVGEPGKAKMLNVHLIVPSQRCVNLAKDLGFKSISLAQSATNQHMLEALGDK